MIRILIVNDDPLIQQMLKRVISCDPDLTVGGIAANGHEAVSQVMLGRFDLALMDIHMPVMDGVEACRQIMAEKPLPILLVTGTISPSMSQIYESLDAGAIEVIKTPVLEGGREFRSLKDLPESGKLLLKRIHILNQLRDSLKPASFKSHVGQPHRTAPTRFSGQTPPGHLVAIGASTGGPNSILSVLQGLRDLPLSAVLVVQHISADFADGFVTWLSQNCDLPVKAAVSGEPLNSNNIYVSIHTDDDLIIDDEGQFQYQRPEPDSVHIPSINATFMSVAKVYGKSAIGVLLTGMGTDGARGMLAIRKAGGLTIAQDEATSVVYGMPRAAVETGGAEKVLPLDAIASHLNSILAPALW